MKKMTFWIAFSVVVFGKVASATEVRFPGSYEIIWGKRAQTQDDVVLKARDILRDYRSPFTNGWVPWDWLSRVLAGHFNRNYANLPGFRSVISGARFENVLSLAEHIKDKVFQSRYRVFEVGSLIQRMRFILLKAQSEGYLAEGNLTESRLGNGQIENENARIRELFQFYFDPAVEKWPHRHQRFQESSTPLRGVHDYKYPRVPLRIGIFGGGPSGLIAAASLAQARQILGSERGSSGASETGKKWIEVHLFDPRLEVDSVGRAELNDTQQRMDKVVNIREPLQNVIPEGEYSGEAWSVPLGILEKRELDAAQKEGVIFHKDFSDFPYPSSFHIIIEAEENQSPLNVSPLLNKMSAIRPRSPTLVLFMRDGDVHNYPSIDEEISFTFERVSKFSSLLYRFLKEKDVSGLSSPYFTSYSELLINEFISNMVKTYDIF